jgi:prepilin-type N-terminal cleavage/methylation domain-containing protein
MRKQSGFTLLEMLVAIAVTLVVVGAALGALNDAARMNQGVALSADMEENLRAGMNLMVRDLIQTGEGIPIGGIPIPTGGSAGLINRPGPVSGAPLTFPPAFTTLPAITPGAGLGPVSLGVPTDIVTILYADNSLPLSSVPSGVILPSGNPSGTTISASGDSLTVDASVPINVGNLALRPGDLIMFSNAQGNALQVITRASGGQSVNFDKNDVYNMNQRNDPQGTIKQIQAPPGSGNYSPTTVTRVWMLTYYLDTQTDPLRPRLMRQVDFKPVEPVGEVLENLQVSFDLVDGVTNPTNVKTPPPANSPNQIRKVNLFLAARSTALYVRTGQYLRQNLVTQVSLRSLAFVNRYQ